MAIKTSELRWQAMHEGGDVLALVVRVIHSSAAMMSK
jgi:hypothetical protein